MRPVDPVTGGVIALVPTGPDGAVAIITPAPGAPVPLQLEIPAPPRPVVVRMQPLMAFPADVDSIVPAGTVLTAAIDIEVVDAATGEVVHHHDPPLSLSLVLPQETRAICAADPTRLALVHVWTTPGGGTQLVRLPPASVSCATGLVSVLLWDTSAAAIAIEPSGLTIPFRTYIPPPQ
jgi:hypothetical protein